MKISKNKMLAFALALVFVSVPLLQTSRAETASITAKDKLFAFLTDNIAINMSEYAANSESYSITYPSTYGGLAKEELVNYEFKADDGSKIYGMAIFDNGFPTAIIFRLYGSVKYAQQPSTSTLEETTKIITRYRTFAERYNIGTDHINPALSMLSQVTEITTSNMTIGNMKMDMKSSSNANGDATKIAWIYSIDGVDVPRKSLSLGIYDVSGAVQISFSDTWGLWSVADIGISEAEAKSIAWNTARNYNLTLHGEDNSTITKKPDWTDDPFTEAALTMTPGQSYNNTLNNALHDANMGSIARNGLTLYPIRQFVFHFNKQIGDIVGIQIGVWGDTKEIAYNGTYGFYGSFPTPTASVQPVTSPQPSGSHDVPINSIIVAAVIFAIAAVSVAGVYLVKRK